ncbi:MAG TPA: DNA-binding transcriptional regulator [Sphingomonadaceae bacterium]|nr:DNA-binding transcriptional regulator [Sphingomonadaceae bacterium]
MFEEALIGESLSAKSEARRDSIRSVERAIDLLQALNRRSISTLHDLHLETGLPKPSIVRLLRTLEAKGMVAQSSSYGTYQLLSHVKTLSCGFHREPLIIEVADEILIEFTKEEGWPLAIALFDVDAMIVRASTIPYTSLSLLHSSLNMRLSMTSRALGRCYLAHCSANERKMILEIIKQSGNEEDRNSLDRQKFSRLLKMVREQGYALRDPTIEPRSSTMAVPVMSGDRVIASLGLTWISVAMSEKRAIELYYPKLVETARRISKALDERLERSGGKLSASPFQGLKHRYLQALPYH